MSNFSHDNNTPLTTLVDWPDHKPIVREDSWRKTQRQAAETARQNAVPVEPQHFPLQHELKARHAEGQRRRAEQRDVDQSSLTPVLDSEARTAIYEAGHMMLAAMLGVVTLRATVETDDKTLGWVQYPKKHLG